MNKSTISTLIILLISVPLIRAQCAPPLVLANEKCEKTCPPGEIVYQGRNICVLNKCSRPNYFSLLNVKLPNLYCLSSGLGNNYIKADSGKCDEGPFVRNFITGLCEDNESFKNKLPLSYGVYFQETNLTGSYFSNEDFDQLLLNPREHQNLLYSRLQVQIKHCETKDVSTDRCIQTIDCFNSNRSLFNDFKRCDCILPNVVSSDGKNCLYKCPENEIPIQIAANHKFKCAISDCQTNSKKEFEFNGFKLSSDYRQFVKLCMDVNEVSCEASGYECVKKLNNGKVDNTCPLTAEQGINLLQRNAIRLFSQKQKYTDKQNIFVFMSEESQWVLEKIQEQDFGLSENIKTLIELNTLSLQIAEAHEYDKGDVIEAKVKNISILVQKFEMKSSGELITKTIFDGFQLNKINKSMNSSIFSLTVFDGKFLCQDKEDCKEYKLVMIQKNDHENDEDISYELRFEVDQCKLDGEIKAYCVKIDKYGKLKIDQEKSVDQSDPAATFIDCVGSSFIGIYYGKIAPLKLIESLSGQIEQEGDNQLRNDSRSDSPSTDPDSATGVALWVIIVWVSLGIVTIISLTMAIYMFMKKQSS